jgi:hypothetical protein
MNKVSQKIIGTFEQVAFPDFQIADLTAKIDTGAYTGSLHCTKIQELQRGDAKLLTFSPFDRPEVTITTEDFMLRQVRSSNGERQSRYFITTNIIISGTTYPIVLSLANRSEMRWPVLIGRKFLRQNHFLVDVRQARNVS